MPDLSKRALAMQESAIRKLDQTVAVQKDVTFLRLNIGQPDVSTPSAILDAIGAFRPDVVAYGPASGLPSCREAAAAYHAKISPGLTAADVAVTVGGSEALLFTMSAICDPGDEIIVPEPYYTNYNGFAALAGAKVVPVRTTLDDGFAFPSNEALDAVRTSKTRAVLFSNPGNPTGAVYGRETLERVAAWAKSHGLFVLSDEVYRRIWFREPPVSALELEDVQDHVAVIYSMSKTYSACGLRIGFLISRNKELMARVERLGQARLGPQPLGQLAAEQALRLPDEAYAAVRALYKQRVAVLYEELLATPGVQTYQPEGAFYMMANLPVDDAESFCRWLVTDFRHEGESLVLAPGPGFFADPSEGRTLVRLAAVLDESKLRRAGKLLRRALSEYPGRVATA